MRLSSVQAVLVGKLGTSYRTKTAAIEGLQNLATGANVCEVLVGLKNALLVIKHK